MKTLVCVEPGKLEYQEKEKPHLTEGQAIIKINRIGICGTDLHAFEGTQPFFSYPRILGHEIAAELVEFNDTLKGFSKGEHITISPYFYCGTCIACRNGKPNCCANINVCGVHVNGGLTEYLAVPEYSLLHGYGLSTEELALVEPLSIGAHGVRRANVQKDEFVLVMGAGPIGLGIMEIARVAGAKVIALDVNEARLDFCKNVLRVDHVVNALQNPSEDIKKITNGDWPTVIIDATGNAKAIMTGFNYLAHGGRYVLVGLQRGEISFSHPEFHKRESTLMSSRNATSEDFNHVIDCMKSGKINSPAFITHRIAFGGLKEIFPSLLNPETGVIKAMIEF